MGVVDGEVGRIVDSFAFDAKNAGKNAVERSHPDVSRFCVAHNLANPQLHFAGSFVGESQRENGKWIDALVDQMGDAVRQNAGFARTCTCYHHHWPFDMSRRGLLRFIQTLKHLHDSKVAGLGLRHLTQSTKVRGIICTFRCWNSRHFT